MTYMMPAQAAPTLEPDRVCHRRALVRGALAQEPHPCDALSALLWVHVFRYVALQVFSAQRDGFPISDSGALEIVIVTSPAR